MDGDFAEKLKQVLSDPEAMSKITSIASGLGMSPQTTSKSEEISMPPQPSVGDSSSVTENENENALPALMQSMSMSSDPRLTLLSSLKPLLREEKRERIDAITRALAIASMMKNFRK